MTSQTHSIVGLQRTLAFVSCMLSAVSAMYAAELQTVAYSAVAHAKKPPITSGALYHLSGARLAVNLTLAVMQEIGTLVTNRSDNTKITNVVSRTYFVVLKKDGENTLEITVEDDPELAFYLIPKSGLMTDTKNGQIQYSQNSGMITQIGLEYEDKTAQAISGTLKLAAEITGIAAGTQIIPKSAADTVSLERSMLDDLSYRFYYTAPIRAHIDDNTTNEVRIELDGAGLTEGQDKLLNKLNERLERMKLPRAEPSKTWNPLTATIEVHSDTALRKLRAEDIFALKAFDGTQEKRRTTSPGKRSNDRGANEMDRVWKFQTEITKGVKAGYIPGILYRVPGNAVVSVSVSDETILFKRVRLPEAGQLGWYGFKSRLFSKVSPSIDLDSNGGLKLLKFASTPASETVLAELQSSKAAIEKLMKDLEAKRAAEATAEEKAAVSRAEGEYKIERLALDIEDLKVDIATLRTKLEQAQTPGDKEAISIEIRKKERSLRLAEKRLELLKKGIEIKSSD